MLLLETSRGLFARSSNFFLMAKWDGFIFHVIESLLVMSA